MLSVLELLMLKRNILAVPGCDFTARDIDILIQGMCNDLCKFYVFFFTLYVLRVLLYNNNSSLWRAESE